MTDTLVPTIETFNEFTCSKCSKPFASDNALRMHNMRVHTRAGKRGAMWKQGAVQSREQFLAKRRIYQTKMRATNIAKGLTSTGQPRKQDVRTNYKGLSEAIKEKQKERHRAYNRNWYQENKTRKMVVYPEPKTYLEGVNAEEVHAINNCPYCGRNIAKHIAIAEGTNE